MANYQNLARKAKQDEFYTQLSDIEREVKRYKDQLKGKTIFCNCDDPETSEFYYYFVSNFDIIGIKKLIATHFEIDKPSYKLEYFGGADTQGDKDTVIKRAIELGKKTPLKQNYEQGDQGELFVSEPTRSYSGDFRSPESIELLKESDVVITNPPFSLFREFVDQLFEYDKKFIIIGSLSAITYKEIFRYIRDNKMWLGYGFQGGNAYFKVGENREYANGVYDNNTGLVKFRNVAWYTNLDVTKRHENMVLYEKFVQNKYPKYDNYDAIEVGKLKEIPMDYTGVMGVPITFVDKYNPDQFEIVGLIAGNIKGMAGIPSSTGKDGPYINGKLKYGRVLVRNRKPATLMETSL
jgi:hypothetical protein